MKNSEREEIKKDYIENVYKRSWTYERLTDKEKSKIIDLLYSAKLFANTKQEKAILQHLQQFGSITSWEAIKEYGATRLSAIILKLRKQGYHIETEEMTTKNRFGNYVNYAKYILMEG